jgi:cephalosporin hydroxylase
MVILDSDHEREHVLKEIELYAPLVTIGSILIIEDGNNHAGVKAAISEFAIDPILNGKRFRKNLMCEKYMLTFNRDGFWEREK